MTDAEQRSVYNSLSKYKVTMTKIDDMLTTYKFGRYTIIIQQEPCDLVMSITQTQGKKWWDIGYWHSSTFSQSHIVYQLYLAAKSKLETGLFKNPYEFLKPEDIAKESSANLEKILLQHTDDILPYGFSAQQYNRLVCETKQYFAQKIQEKCK